MVEHTNQLNWEIEYILGPMDNTIHSTTKMTGKDILEVAEKAQAWSKWIDAFIVSIQVVD